jgi:mediator of RNA polymerase II transcription subunit 17
MNALASLYVLDAPFRHTIRFTFVSPSTLVAHLSQSTLTVSSVPQLCQLLMDEVEQCLLNRIRDLGKSLSENVEGTWFIDLDHCVGRWEGCVLWVFFCIIIISARADIH